MAKVVIAEMLQQAVGRGPPRRRGAGRRSRLYGWMWLHYDAIAEGLNQPGAPSWADLEVHLADLAREGHPVQDGEGQAPSAETLRKTWGKVRRAKALAAEAGAAPTPARSRPAIPQLGDAIPSLQAATASEDEEPDRPRFGFARPRT